MNRRRGNLEAEFGRLLLPLARRWRAEADRSVAGLGLSHASGWVLLHVGRLGDAVRQSDLAAAVDIRGSSLVRLIDQLSAAGLVARKVEKGDRRINRIALTALGRDLVSRIEKALRTLRQEMLAEITDDDLAIAKRVLQQLDRRILERREQAR